MIIYQHFQPNAASPVAFTPYLANAVVAVIPPENGGVTQYLGVVETQAVVGGFNNRPWWGYHYGVTADHVRVTVYKEQAGSLVKLATEIRVPAYVYNVNTQFCGDYLVIATGYPTGTAQVIVVDVLTGDAEFVPYAPSGGWSAAGTLYVSGRSYAALRHLNYVQFVDVTEMPPRMCTTTWAPGASAKGDLLAHYTAGYVDAHAHYTTGYVNVQGMILDASNNPVFDPARSASVAFAGVVGQPVFSVDNSTELLCVYGKVTLNLADFSLTKQVKPTAGFYHTVSDYFSSPLPYYSSAQDVFIGGYYKNPQYATEPVGGAYVADTATGNSKVVSSDWAAAQNLVTDTFPAVIGNKVICLNAQAVVYDGTGKVTQLGYVDVDSPSTIASLAARSDANWWQEPAQTNEAANSQFKLVRHSSTTWEFVDRIGATVSLSHSNALLAGARLRVWELVDSEADLAQALIGWRGDMVRAHQSGHIKYQSRPDVESSLYVWGLTPSGEAGANCWAEFSELSAVVAAQAYAPTFGTYVGNMVAYPPASFMQESATCVNAVDRTTFLNAWQNRGTANFVEVELVELYPTPKVAYRIFKGGINVVEHVMVGGYPEMAADDGTGIANPIDYTLYMMLGTAYSKREVFVECLTGDLDLRQ